ncbi:type II toxin-antitoxin system VapC family toxin [Candidatus Poribacteria bacterium]|nr:type II toxin-antitoxin system VapC family toxin [Candidatus Poribacteria bacterium]
MRYFFDSSAIVKRHIAETGSDWVKTIVKSQPKKNLYLSFVTGAEATAAFAKRHRNRDISTEDYNTARSVFQHHFQQQYTLLRVTKTVIQRAMDLIHVYPLRGFDAVQLATALILEDNLKRSDLAGITFVCADKDLCDAARAEGLTPENPNDHL